MENRWLPFHALSERYFKPFFSKISSERYYFKVAKKMLLNQSRAWKILFHNFDIDDWKWTLFNKYISIF